MISPSTKAKAPPPACCHLLNSVSVPSNKYWYVSSSGVGAGVGIKRSPARRERAIPESIGLGDPIDGSRHGPPAYRYVDSQDFPRSSGTTVFGSTGIRTE